MTREEVIENLKNKLNDLHNGYQTYLEHGGKQDIETENDIEALGIAIEALQEPQVGGWIPVSERLPEEEGKYLCVYGKNLMRVYSFSNDLYSVDDYDFAKYKFEKKKGFYTYDSEWGYCEVNFIKAWQPLPELYRESVEE